MPGPNANTVHHGPALPSAMDDHLLYVVGVPLCHPILDHLMLSRKMVLVGQRLGPRIALDVTRADGAQVLHRHPRSVQPRFPVIAYLNYAQLLAWSCHSRWCVHASLHSRKHGL